LPELRSRSVCFSTGLLQNRLMAHVLPSSCPSRWRFMVGSRERITICFSKSSVAEFESPKSFKRSFESSRNFAGLYHTFVLCLTL
jgi:hypothetical protein